MKRRFDANCDIPRRLLVRGRRRNWGGSDEWVCAPPDFLPFGTGSHFRSGSRVPTLPAKRSIDDPREEHGVHGRESIPEMYSIRASAHDPALRGTAFTRPPSSAFTHCCRTPPTLLFFFRGCTTLVSPHRWISSLCFSWADRFGNWTIFYISQLTKTTLKVDIRETRGFKALRFFKFLKY